MPAVGEPRTLAEFELFHDLLPDELVRLNALLHRTTFAPGTTLMSEEQPGEVAYLIVAGTVKVQAFGEAYGERAADGSIVIPLQLTQSDLAGLVGASRSRVNQVLGYYRERHYLSLDAHGRIVIHDRAALEQRCG